MKNTASNRNNSFKVPEKYFEELQARLNQIPGQAVQEAPQGFKTPEGYLAQLNQRLLDIPNQNKKESKIIRLWQNHQRFMVAAAVALLIFPLGIYLALQQPSETTPIQTYAAEETLYELYFEEEEPIEIADASFINEFDELLQSNAIGAEESKKPIEKSDKPIPAQKETVDDILEEILFEDTDSALNQMVEESLNEETLFY